MGDELNRQVVAKGERQEVIYLLARVCALTTMRFAAVSRVTDSRWISCQVDDRMDFGLAPGDELELRMTMCDEIRQSGQAIIVDSMADSVHWSTHAVPAFYGFQSYISMPVYLADGSFWGTLCALDSEPVRISDPAIVAAMEEYARQMSALLE